MSAGRFLLLAGRWVALAYAALALLTSIGPCRLWRPGSAAFGEGLVPLTLLAVAIGVLLRAMISGPRLFRLPAPERDAADGAGEPVVIFLAPQPGRNGGVLDRDER